MSCTALNLLTGERVAIPPDQNARDIWTAEQLAQMVSPRSRYPVTPVRPVFADDFNGELRRRSHWRLKGVTRAPWNDEFIFDPEYGEEHDGVRMEGGESAEHLHGKVLVQELLQKRIAEAGKSYRVTLEEHIPIARCKQYRIADVCVLDGDTPIEIHEIQFSRISAQEIAERTLDYEAHGIITPVWYLGPKLYGSESIRQALANYTEEYVQIDIEQKTEFIKSAEMCLSAFV